MEGRHVGVFRRSSLSGWILAGGRYNYRREHHRRRPAQGQRPRRPHRRRTATDAVRALRSRGLPSLRCGYRRGRADQSLPPRRPRAHRCAGGDHGAVAFTAGQRLRHPRAAGGGADRRGTMHRLCALHRCLPRRRHRRRTQARACSHPCLVHGLRPLHTALPRRLHCTCRCRPRVEPRGCARRPRSPPIASGRGLAPGCAHRQGRCSSLRGGHERARGAAGCGRCSARPCPGTSRRTASRAHRLMNRRHTRFHALQALAVSPP